MEPERKIEKLLRAFAKKRRDDAGDAFTLHPATRRLLQDAAHQVSKSDDAGWLLNLLGGLRPGFVVAVGFAVLVVVGAALLLPGLSKAKRRELAIAPVASPAVALNDQSATTATEPTTPSVTALAMETRKAETDTLLHKETLESNVAETLVATTATGGAAKLAEVDTANPLFFNVTNVASTPSPPPSAEVALSSPASTGNSRLQNVFKNAAASAKVAPVLAHFQFTQNGSAITVVDGDGSIYNGYWVAGSEGISGSLAAKPSLHASAPTARTKDKDAGRQSQAGGAQNFFFRVTGTNRSLNQNVVFTGNVVALTNPATWLGQSNITNSRIEGTAVINHTNTIEINGLPVAP